MIPIRVIHTDICTISKWAKFLHHIIPWCINGNLIGIILSLEIDGSKWHRINDRYFTEEDAVSARSIFSKFLTIDIPYVALTDELGCVLLYSNSDLFLLQWRHNGCNGVSNRQRLGCLLIRVFRRRSKKAPKLLAIGLCDGNSPGTGEYPHQWPVTRKMYPFDDIITVLGLVIAQIYVESGRVMTAVMMAFLSCTLRVIHRDGTMLKEITHNGCHFMGVGYPDERTYRFICMQFKLTMEIASFRVK